MRFLKTYSKYALIGIIIVAAILIVIILFWCIGHERGDSTFLIDDDKTHIRRAYSESLNSAIRDIEANIEAVDFVDTASFKLSAAKTSVMQHNNKGKELKHITVNDNSNQSKALNKSEETKEYKESKETIYKRHWVVDKEAWKEEKIVPVTKYRPTWWHKNSIGQISKFYSKDKAYKKYMDEAGSWGTGEDEAYLTYETMVIEHEEVGHWE